MGRDRSVMVEHRFADIPQDARRGRAWVASHAPLWEVRLDPAATVPLTAFHRYHHLGDAVLGVFEAPAQTAERTEATVARQALDHVVLRTHTRGRASVSVDGWTAEVGPGDIVVFDLAHHVLIAAEPSTGVELVLPRRLLTGAAAGIPGPHGQLLPGDHPLIRMVADHLRNLAACLPASPPAQVTHLVPATLGLCRALLTVTGDRGGEARPYLTGIAIRRFIEENLSSVDVPMLMARFGLSRAPLYRKFGGEGGISTYIRDRRLAAAMRRLRGAETGDRLKVARLAHEAGFASERTFSRAFHRKYGLWPAEASDVRENRGLTESDSLPMKWLRDL